MKRKNEGKNTPLKEMFKNCECKYTEARHFWLQFLQKLEIGLMHLGIIFTEMFTSSSVMYA